MMGRPQRNWGVLAPLCLLLLFLLTLGASYKPVVVVHGLFDSPSVFSHLLHFINQTHPGTNVTVVDLFDHSQSLKPLWVQVEGFRQAISPIMQNAADGVHLICYSQGTAGPRGPDVGAPTLGCRRWVWIQLGNLVEPQGLERGISCNWGFSFRASRVVLG
uniref:Palmitoyl-protein thioesterase 2 n=1 Tax=Chrysemys picta bellii TaxID=8478 RepID=A0A8C3HDW2_CHRPI